jgi:hypothetical protein
MGFGLPTNKVNKILDEIESIIIQIFKYSDFSIYYQADSQISNGSTFAIYYDSNFPISKFDASVFLFQSFEVMIHYAGGYYSLELMKFMKHAIPLSEKNIKYSKEAFKQSFLYAMKLLELRMENKELDILKMPVMYTEKPYYEMAARNIQEVKHIYKDTTAILLKHFGDRITSEFTITDFKEHNDGRDTVKYIFEVYGYCIAEFRYAGHGEGFQIILKIRNGELYVWNEGDYFAKDLDEWAENVKKEIELYIPNKYLEYYGWK